MHLHFNKRTLCALAALAAAWAPAQAAMSTSSASIEQFQFRLVDLDLNDGVDPWITFGTDSRSLTTVGGGQTQQISASGTTSIVTQFGAAGGTLSDTALTSRSSVNHPLPRDDFNHIYTNVGSRVTEFVLSPNTELILTSVGNIAQQLDTRFANSGARIGMQAHLVDEIGNWENQFNKGYSIESRNGSATVNLYGSLMSIGKEHRGQFELDASTYLTGPVTSVPEPSTYAMLLTGAVMLGAVARRRRKAAAARSA